MLNLSNYLNEAKVTDNKVKYINSKGKEIKFRLYKRGKSERIDTDNFPKNHDLYVHLGKFIGGYLVKSNEDSLINDKVIAVSENWEPLTKGPSSVDLLLQHKRTGKRYRKQASVKFGETYVFTLPQPSQAALDEIINLKPGEKHIICDRYLNDDSNVLIAYLLNAGVGYIYGTDTNKYTSNNKLNKEVKYGTDDMSNFFDREYNYHQAYVQDGILHLYAHR